MTQPEITKPSFNLALQGPLQLPCRGFEAEKEQKWTLQKQQKEPFIGRPLQQIKTIEMFL